MYGCTVCQRHGHQLVILYGRYICMTPSKAPASAVSTFPKYLTAFRRFWRAPRRIGSCPRASSPASRAHDPTKLRSPYPVPQRFTHSSQLVSALVMNFHSPSRHYFALVISISIHTRRLGRLLLSPLVVMQAAAADE